MRLVTVIFVETVRNIDAISYGVPPVNGSREKSYKVRTVLVSPHNAVTACVRVRDAWSTAAIHLPSAVTLVRAGRIATQR